MDGGVWGSKKCLSVINDSYGVYTINKQQQDGHTSAGEFLHLCNWPLTVHTSPAE